jgi:AcrR family transcriptional regulator
MARTRSARAHHDVLKATLKLIADRGIDVTSVDAIAEASGVSKATIYKHWRTKEELCLEAIGTVDGKLPVFNSANPRSDLIELLRFLAQKSVPEAMGKLLPRIIGHAVGNPAFGIALSARFEEPRRALVIQLVTRAIFLGQLRADLDVETAPDILYGPIMHRRLLNTAVPLGLPEKIVEVFWMAFAPPVKKPAKKHSRPR